MQSADKLAECKKGSRDSQLGQSLGLNHQTVNSYMDYITGCFLVRLLEPYHANTRKRLVKSPKVVWRDSGVLHVVLQNQTLDELFAQSWVGASWEGFVIEQLINHLNSCDSVFTPYHLRTSDQHEIDLLLDFGSTLWAIEITLTSSPDSDTARRLNKTADLVDADRRINVSRTEETSHYRRLHLYQSERVCWSCLRVFRVDYRSQIGALLLWSVASSPDQLDKDTRSRPRSLDVNFGSDPLLCSALPLLSSLILRYLARFFYTVRVCLCSSLHLMQQHE